MKIEKCWCGSERWRRHARFHTEIRPWRWRHAPIATLVRCLDCSTVRMLDNGVDGLPDYTGSYNYKDLSPRHLRTMHLVRTYCHGDSILDVGCNTGLLLQGILSTTPSLTRGKGIDIDGEAVRIGTDKYGLDLSCTDLNELTGTFDNIVLCHTLEHVSDLKGYLTHADRLLSPNGRLFISIPNIASWNARVLLREWGGLAPLHHVWYFDPSSLSRCASEFLPEYSQLHISTSFIWKPLLCPSACWNALTSGHPEKLSRPEKASQGDQLDLVLAKTGESPIS